MTSFNDHLIAKRLARIAVKITYRDFRRQDMPSEAERLWVGMDDYITRFAEIIEDKTLDAMRDHGLRKSILELANSIAIFHLRVEIARLKGEKSGTLPTVSP